MYFDYNSLSFKDIFRKEDHPPQILETNVVTLMIQKCININSSSRNRVGKTYAPKYSEKQIKTQGSFR